MKCLTIAALAAWLILGTCSATLTSAQAIEMPKVIAKGLKVELIANEPEIVTPVSCTVASNGDLFVIESATHFRPENYARPEHDRIWRYRANPVTGKLEQQVVLQSTKYTMQVMEGPDDWLYLATRYEVRRIRPAQATTLPIAESELVLRLDTKGNYPHNGLSGLVFGPDGSLYVGIGENFGEPFALLDSRGQGIQGGGEGGSIFRCQVDGSSLVRIATGFWNPFGLCFDRAGRLWVVDNDPDASPPCRLVHVVPGGDYGFEFRFGRAGTHPLQAWNGELPGTLGFAAGTGEAPCAVVFHRGYLWVTSWGDNRIERYKLSSNGATVAATPEVVVQGGTQFRPVGLSLARDGSLYFTDWVDRSYNLHNKGRIWRLTFGPESESTDSLPRSELENRAASLSGDSLWRDMTKTIPATNLASIEAATVGLSETDPFLQAAARWRWIKSDQLDSIAWQRLESPRARSNAIQAFRWKDLDRPSPIATESRQTICKAALLDPSDDVRLVGLRWIAESRDDGLRSEVDALLVRADLSPRVCLAAFATLEWLDRGTVERTRVGGHRLAASIVVDTSRSPELRATALRLLPANDRSLTVEQLTELANQPPPLQRQAIRTLALRGDAPSMASLQQLAKKSAIERQARADAVMGLANDSEGQRTVLEALASDTVAEVRTEAERILARLTASTQKANQANRPAATDLEGWKARFASGGNADAGWRVFFRSGAGQCSACHAFQGHGSQFGPDLSTLAGTQPRARILESIVQPSRDIGPLYVPWQILTVGGQVLTGVKLHAPGVGEKTRYLASNGKTFDISLTDIEEQRMASESIMPNGLCDNLSDDEIRDLLTLLSGR